MEALTGVGETWLIWTTRGLAGVAVAMLGAACYANRSLATALTAKFLSNLGWWGQTVFWALTFETFFKYALIWLDQKLIHEEFDSPRIAFFVMLIALPFIRLATNPVPTNPVPLQSKGPGFVVESIAAVEGVAWWVVGLAGLWAAHRVVVVLIG